MINRTHRSGDAYRPASEAEIREVVKRALHDFPRAHDRDPILAAQAYIDALQGVSAHALRTGYQWALQGKHRSKWLPPATLRILCDEAQPKPERKPQEWSDDQPPAIAPTSFFSRFWERLTPDQRKRLSEWAVLDRAGVQSEYPEDVKAVLIEMAPNWELFLVPGWQAILRPEATMTTIGEEAARIVHKLGVRRAALLHRGDG